MQVREILVALTFTLATLIAGTAYAVETLHWEDLAPPWDESRNPVARLTAEQQDDVYVILWGPNYGDPSGKRNAEEQQAYDKLKASGVDPDAIFKKIDDLRKDMERHDETLVFDLDKKVVKLPGFVLPLELEGKLVKSFLLVPNVGACIHVPPPPVNQIVYVDPEMPFVSEEHFAPVWVTGRITVGMDRESLTLVDGTSNVDFGYSMQASKIEPYTKQ